MCSRAARQDARARGWENMRLVLVCAALVVVVMTFASRAAAESIYSMEPVNGSYSTTFKLVSKTPEYADVGGQFEVTLAKESNGQISFTFENHVGVSASIHEIYFYDGHLFGDRPEATVSASSGVTYQASHVAPSDFKGNFPTGLASTSAVRFYATDSNSGGSALQGLNAQGEWLKISFQPLAGISLETVWGDLIKPYSSTAAEGYTLKPFFIGLHVGSLPGGKSDWYGTDRSTTPVVPVPLPPAVLGAGALLVCGVVRRQFRQAAGR